MPKKYNKLWVIGDSYTTPNVCVNPQESFWGLAASELGISQIVNCSRRANSWTSVQHLVISLSQEIDWHNDLLFVGIPPLERVTIFDDHRDTEYQGCIISTDSWSSEMFDIPSHRGLISLSNYGNDQQMVIHHDRSWLETDVCRQVFVLSQWLDSISASYLILNLSKDFDENNIWGPSSFVLPYCKNLEKSILFKNTYHGINIGVNKPVDSDDYNGHHGAEGNAYFFFNSLLPKLKQCDL